jgi:hypothetical protein
MKSMLVTSSLVFLTLLLCSDKSAADEVVKENANGGINWSQGVVYAIGYGTAKPDTSPAQKRILSRRAAIVDAQRNLLEMTKGVRINSVLKTDQAMNESRETATRVEGLIKGAQVTKQHYQNEVSTVTMAMPIAGKFLEAVYSEQTAIESIATNSSPAPRQEMFQIIRKPLIPALQQLNNTIASSTTFILNSLIPSANAAETIVIRDEDEVEAYKKLLEWMQAGNTLSVEDMLTLAITDYEQNSQFSGLLIDASNVVNFELATVPKIRDDEGNILYPSKNTSYDNIVKKRGVTYDFDLNDAIRNQRVATSPFIIKALSTYKNLDSDLIISSADAKKISQSASTLQAMNQAGVLIVVAL